MTVLSLGELLAWDPQSSVNALLAILAETSGSKRSSWLRAGSAC